MSNEFIKPPTISNYSLSPELTYVNFETRVFFYGSCLKQYIITFTHEKILNIYIVYKLSPNLIIHDFTLENCFFGTVKLTKNNDIDKYKYSGYGIGFDSSGTFLFPDGGFGQNVIRFGADMSSSVHANDKTKNSLVLDEGITLGLDDTSLTSDKKYSIKFTKSNTKFCLSLHYNGADSYLFINGKEIIKFKAKDSEIVANPIFLGNISEDFSVTDMKKTELYGYIYDFSVDYRAIAADKIQDIHKYLMEKNNIV